MGSGQSSREDERVQRNKLEKKRDDDRTALAEMHKTQNDELQEAIAKKEEKQCYFQMEMEKSRNNAHKHQLAMLTDAFKEQRAQDEQRRKQEAIERAEQMKLIVNAIKYFLLAIPLMAVGIWTYCMWSAGKSRDLAEGLVTKERVMGENKILKLKLQFEQDMRAKEQAEMLWKTAGGTLLVTLILLVAVLVGCGRGIPAPGRPV